jgi:hypothetical protein
MDNTDKNKPSRKKIEEVKVIQNTKQGDFEDEVNGWLKEGYKISSTSCGFFNSEAYDFCEHWQAILVKEGVSKET